jgi:Phospholipase_D-nuclease N-terminal
MKGSALSEEHWLQQPRFKMLFAVSAEISALLLVLGVIANIVLSYRGGLFAQMGPVFEVLGIVVGVTGASAALYLWIGMGWYWLRLDDSPSSAKKFWFVILLVLNWVGAIAYYFAVYRRWASALAPR